MKLKYRVGGKRRKKHHGVVRKAWITQKKKTLIGHSKEEGGGFFGLKFMTRIEEFSSLQVEVKNLKLLTKSNSITMFTCQQVKH